MGELIKCRYSKDFVHKTVQNKTKKRIEKIVFSYGNKIYIQSRLTWKAGNEGGSFLRVADLKLL